MPTLRSRIEEAVRLQTTQPNFGVVLLGLFFGKAVYADRGKKEPSAGGPRYAAPIQFLGRHTLLIYLIHQPILIAVLWALGLISF
jgi:uncharacterized membrane protein